MKITIEEVSNSLKELFYNADILSIDQVYEKIDNSDDLKLIIFFNKIFKDDISVMYTKFIFIVDKDKVYLKDNYFSYLYDINCIYYKVKFSDLNDMKNKIKDIYDNEKFGDNSKVLSKFIESPATLINNWFEKNDIQDISIFNIIYDPKIYIIPCKFLSFSFKININNSQEIELIVKKEDSNEFYYNFKIYDNTITVKKSNLSTLVETIGETIKNNIQK